MRTRQEGSKGLCVKLYSCDVKQHLIHWPLGVCLVVGLQYKPLHIFTGLCSTRFASERTLLSLPLCTSERGFTLGCIASQSSASLSFALADTSSKLLTGCLKFNR